MRIKQMTTWGHVVALGLFSGQTAARSIAQFREATLTEHGMEFTDRRSVMARALATMRLVGVTAMMVSVDLIAL